MEEEKYSCIPTKDGEITIVGLAYEDDPEYLKIHGEDPNGDTCSGKLVVRQLSATLKTKKIYRLWNEKCTGPNILNTFDSIGAESCGEDTMIIYYAGHGKPDHLDVPGKDYLCGEFRDLSKSRFFESIGKFRGRKIVILSCCHGGYDLIPANTLLVAPSKINTTAYVNEFKFRLGDHIGESRCTKNPLGTLIGYFLEEHHNYPYGPLKDGFYEDKPRRSEVYQQEKTIGMPILPDNEQRGNVTSTLAEDGIPLDVDPRCNFL